MVKVGVLLSGCGFLDGSEIHEAVLALLALDRAGAQVLCMAPDLAQVSVVNHRTGESEGKPRNVLDESARIARGQIVDVRTVSAADIDALVLPGGYGAAKNLCDFAVAGAAARVTPEVARLVREVHAAGKPICALCIAPTVIAAVLGKEHPSLSIGSDAETARALETMGAKHVLCPVTESRVDHENLIVCTPAYMYDARIGEVALGIEHAIETLMGMVH